MTTETTTALRMHCGHDSRSVTNCLHCEAADVIEGLRRDLAQALDVVQECKAALAEELAAWDIDPPLHHVAQAHARCDQLLSLLCKQKAKP